MGRKASTIETDITFKSHAPKILSEGEVLQPVSRTIKSDDWPIYLLKDAIVYGKDDESPANLLHAEFEGPFSIRGKLVVDRDYQHLRLLKDKEYKDCVVEVKGVLGFSIGDGPITIWANGKAGWFEIKPATAYQNIYNKMTEAIELYYTLCDIHTEVKPRNKSKVQKNQKSLDEGQVFDKYIQRNGDKFTQSKVKRLCTEHAKFLLSQMKIESSTDMNWIDTPFYKWLARNSPDDCNLHKPTSSYAGRQSGMSAIGDNQNVSNRKTQSSQATRSKLQSTATTIVQFMNDMHTSGILRIPRMNIRSLARIMFERFEIIDEDVAKEVIRAHSKKILQGLDDKWTVSPIYLKLEILSTEHQKVRSTGLQEKASGLVLQLRDCGEDGQDKGQLPHLVSSPTGKTKLPQTQVAGPISTPSPVRRKAGKGAGKGAGLRLKGTPASQFKRSPTPEDELSDTRSAKRQKLKYATMEDNSAEDESDEDEDEVYDAADNADDLPMKFGLESTVLPSSIPQGPDGLWTCPKEACKHTIPNADEPNGRAKVQSHFLWHADEIAARENLVKEAHRPYLPIGNLLDKLRRLGEAARSREDDNGRKTNGNAEPTSIKRALAT